MSFRGLALAATLAAALAGARAEAAWNNAFQVTCFGCRNRASSYYAPPTAAYYAPPTVAYAAPPAPSPCGCCQTSYVQKSYYVPVTSYKTVCEPVTTYRTSHYWEPVCSYRTSCYHDPCTGASIQVTQPVTSYRQRTQCNAVTSYVQRCVPVTSYRMAYRLEPVTNCPPGMDGGMAGAPGAPNVNEFPPGIGGNNIAAPANPIPMQPNVSEYPPIVPNSIKKPAAVRMDKVVSRESSGATVRGQVVSNNFVTPLRGARVLFVSKTAADVKQGANADTAGRFAVSLPAGGWNLYISRPDGTLDFHSSIDVQDSQNRQVMVVSR